LAYYNVLNGRAPPHGAADTLPRHASADGPVPAGSVELTILMPCLNEAETLATCIAKAKGYLARSGVSGEVLIADNGSTDGSQEIARSLGARVVDVERKGYGAALLGGIESARGRYVVMGDADDSYDFADLDGFLTKLREGYDLVMGNRFEGGIKPGAMPWKNRYIGNPVLSTVGRVFYSSGIRDFHCGLRGFSREAIRQLGLRTTGMEFASEMVVEATLHGLRIAEVPTTLSPDGRSRPPHLKPWRDGWRHLRFLLTYSPKWLFLYPGAVLLALGVLGAGHHLRPGERVDRRRRAGGHTLVVAALAAVLGVQSLVFGLLATQFGAREGLLPETRGLDRVLRSFSVESAAVVGAACFALGLVGLFAATWIWSSRDFGDLDYRETMRLVVPAAAMVAVGMQIVLAGFVSACSGSRSGP
jgi:glycosyltransferase involved in cell wall biosynthesis